MTIFYMFRQNYISDRSIFLLLDWISLEKKNQRKYKIYYIEIIIYAIIQ